MTSSPSPRDPSDQVLACEDASGEGAAKWEDLWDIPVRLRCQPLGERIASRHIILVRHAELLDHDEFCELSERGYVHSMSSVSYTYSILYVYDNEDIDIYVYSITKAHWFIITIM